MQKKSSLKPFYLSLSKWRCGDFGKNRLGIGNTCLKNDQGFMCCLGQGLAQLDPEVQIKHAGLPADTFTEHPLFVSKNGRNTRFSASAAKINDAERLTTQQRVVALEFLLQGEGYRLVVVD